MMRSDERHTFINKRKSINIVNGLRLGAKKSVENHELKRHRYFQGSHNKSIIFRKFN